MARRGREFWQELIREYDAGGGRESHRDFAVERRVSVGTFRTWLYRLRGERKEGPSLLPVRVIASTAPSARRWGEGAMVEVELPSGSSVGRNSRKCGRTTLASTTVMTTPGGGMPARIGRLA